MKSPYNPINAQAIDYGNAQFFGDFNGGNQTINLQRKPEFVELNLEELKLREFNKNLKTDNLLEIIKNHRILVIGGDIGIDKGDLALEIAYFLALENVQSTPGYDKETKLVIRQWRRSSNQEIIDIDLELGATQSPTIFVINELRPNDVKSKLVQIYNAVKSSKKHYLVVTTDETLSKWHLTDQAKMFFPDLTGVSFYHPDDLFNALNEKLKKDELSEKINFRLSSSDEKDNLEQFLLKNAFQNNYPLTNEKLIKLIAENLRTLRNIVRFVELFQSSKSLSIVQLIESAKSDSDFINRLYYDRLTPREQLLALGLSFFNGIFEDQLFAALEKVVQIAWQKRDNSLRALDYCDLEKLQDDFFKLTKNDLYEGKPPDFKVIKTKDYDIDIRSITIISLANRRMLFEVAWESHRRQIIAALPVLVKLVEQSVTEDYRQWELYGSSIRCQKLRSVISETLSEIALISTSATSAVQSALITLAQDQNFVVQDVAANAIARWRDPNIPHGENIKPNQELFKTFQLFYSIAIEQEYKAQTIVDIITLQKSEARKLQKSIEKKNNRGTISFILESLRRLYNSVTGKQSEPEENQEEEEEYYYLKEIKENWRDYIGGTVALTLGYAAIYEYRERAKLPDDLYDWLKELSGSRLRIVHKYFGYFTLFHVVPLHLTQLRNLLKEATQNHEEDFLNYAIARSLAHAYDDPVNHVEIAKILDEWYYESVNKRTRRINLKKITHHDALLKTVALTYGLIKYTDQQATLKLNNVINRLHEILQEEEHFFVREGVVKAVCLLIRQYFHQIESQLQDLVANINNSERNDIIEALKEVYLQERENLKGGNQEIKIKNRRYQIWSDLEKRPPTAIELVMDNWAKLEQKKQAQKMVINALVSFAIALE